MMKDTARSYWTFLYYILPAFLLVVACNSDEKGFSYKDIEGDWEVVYAERNGIETSTFQKSIFTFSSDSIFSTNIPRLENQGKVRLKGNDLLVETGDLTNTKLFMIDSTRNLQLKTDIAGFKFIITLERK